MLSKIDPRKVFNLFVTSCFLAFCMVRAMYHFGPIDGLTVAMALFILMPYAPRS